MTKFKQILLVSVLSCLGLKAMAYDFEVNGIYYKKNSDKTVSVTYKDNNYNSYSGSVIIPSTVTYRGISYSVTSIDSRAFTGCINLTSVEIPDSFVGSSDSRLYVFDDCTGLVSINVNSGNARYSSMDGVLYSKQQDAIWKCPARKEGSYIMPNSVIYIAGRAFENCTGLTSIKIPNSMTIIGSGTFKGCTGLTNVEISESVTWIGDRAFKGCTGLTSITIPNNVVYIGIEVFSDCINLKTLNYNAISCSTRDMNGFLPDGSWLDGCSNIEAVNIGNNVKAISPYFLRVKNKITSITIPDSVTDIGVGAFSGCTNLKTLNYNAISCEGTGFCQDSGYNDNWLSLLNNFEIVNIGDNVKVIPDWFIYGKTKIKSITIPNEVEYINNHALDSCMGLTDINVNSGNNYYSSIDGVLYNKQQDTIFKYPAGKEGSFVIPNSVTCIYDNAFSNCIYLTRVSIPSNVTAIGDKAFLACTDLQTIFVESITPPKTYYYAGEYTSFNKNSKNIKVYVPCSSVSQYRSSKYWNYFCDNNIIGYNSIIKIDTTIYGGYYNKYGLYKNKSGEYVGHEYSIDGCLDIYLVDLHVTFDSLLLTDSVVNINPTYCTLQGSFINYDALPSSTGAFQYKLYNDSAEYITVSADAGNNKFTRVITELIPNTTYQYRTLMLLSNGDTIFGEIKSFITPTLNISNQALEIMTCSAKITGTCNDGRVTKGMQYRQVSDINWIDATQIESEDTVITAVANGLLPDKNYIYRAFAIISTGDTIYSEIDTFMTQSLISKLIASNIALTSATLMAVFNYDENFISKGIKCADKIIVGENDDSLTANITQLSPDKQYNYQAFAVLNIGDTIWGNLKSFKTLTFVNQLEVEVNYISAILIGNFVKDSDIIRNGIILGDSVIVQDVVDTLRKKVTGLKINTDYLYRAFVIMSWGDTVYTEYQIFTTKNIEIFTCDATNINRNIATLKGKVEFGDVQADSIKIGFVISNNNSFIDAENNFADTIFVTTVNGDYVYNLTDLDAVTTYYYYAYAEAYGNIYGIDGDKVSFITLPLEKQGNLYLINDAEDLKIVSSLVNSQESDYAEATYKLTNDITLSKGETNNITAIGNSTENAFKGTFDGANHVIYNINIEQLQGEGQGLFGYTDGAKISNLGVANINVISRRYTGGMIGYAVNSTITNCYVRGGNLYATSYSGGLMGYQSAGDESIIQGCYNTCTVEGNNYIGGLLGYSNKGVVRNSYVAAPIIAHGDEAIGAIIGGAEDVLTYDFYFSTTTTGQDKAVGKVTSKKGSSLKAGEGRSDEEMKDDEFVTMLNNRMTTPVWVKDFTVHINDGFPILNWQNGTNATVSTYVATDIKETTATLHGKVVIEGEGIVSQGFFYRATTDNDYTSVEVTGEDIEYTLTNLQPETQYLFKAYASSASDTVFGEEMTLG